MTVTDTPAPLSTQTRPCPPWCRSHDDDEGRDRVVHTGYFGPYGFSDGETPDVYDLLGITRIDDTDPAAMVWSIALPSYREATVEEGRMLAEELLRAARLIEEDRVVVRVEPTGTTATS